MTLNLRRSCIAGTRTLTCCAVAALLTALLCGAAQAAVRAVALWDLVPNQTMQSTFNVGVVAFHISGAKVEFRVNGTLAATALNPTRNPQTNVWEFWFPLDPSQYPDGPLTVDARAIPLEASPVTYDLPQITMYANSHGSLTVSTVKWVDSANGSDTAPNDGTEALPYKTLAKAVANTPAGGTVNLKAGSYSSQALGGGSNRLYWTTVQAAPGVARDAVEVGPGRPSTQRIRWKDLTLYCDSDTGGYTTILSGENGTHSVWLDNVKSYNKKGRWGADAVVFGNKYVPYVTGGLTTEMSGGPGGLLVRDHTLQKITSDAWTGGGKLVVNSVCIDIDPGTTGAHPDFHQSYAKAPEYVENSILYNVRGYQCISQGLFGSRLKNSAFVNVLFEKYNTVMYSQYSGELHNVLFLHINIVNQSWLWRGNRPDCDAQEDIAVCNSIFGSMGLAEQNTGIGLTIDNNHFSSTTSNMGTNKTTGPTDYRDPANRDYRLLPTSPAYGTGIYLQCVPADMDGVAFGSGARNRGAYSAGLPLEVQGWELALDLAAAGQRRQAVSTGYTVANTAAPSAIRVNLSAAVDPATLTAAAVTISGQSHGNQASRIAGLALENSGATIVITLASPLPDVDRYTVALAPTIAGSSGLPISGPASLAINCLAGDVDSSGTVDLGDIFAIRSQIGQPIGDATFRYDISASGAISAGDLQAARAALGHALP